MYSFLLLSTFRSLPFSLHHAIAIRIYKVIVILIFVFLLILLFIGSTGMCIIHMLLVSGASCFIPLDLVYNLLITSLQLLLQMLNDLWYNYILQFLGIMLICLHELSTHDKLKPIFHLRLSPSFYQIGYLSPLVTNIQPFIKEVNIVLNGPLALVDRRIQCRQPSLPALLAISLNKRVVFLLLFR